jgi:hypothetical protein
VKLLVCLVLAAGSAHADDFVCPAVTAKPAQADAAWPLLAKIAPTDSWPCLDGTVVGVMLDSSGLTAALSWGNGVHPFKSDPGGRFLFITGDRQPSLPYFVPAPGDKNVATFGTALGDGSNVSYLGGIVGLPSGKRLGLERDAQLVRIRVNKGKGNAAGPWMSFLADDIQVLDRRTAYPIDVSKAVRTVLGPLESPTAASGKRWRDKLGALVDAQARKAKLPAAAKRNPDVVEGGYRATWVNDTLRVVFYGHLQREYVETVRNADPHAGQPWCEAPSGADCAPQTMPRHTARTFSFRAEFSFEATFDKTGKQLASNEHSADAPPLTSQRFAE